MNKKTNWLNTPTVMKIMKLKTAMYTFSRPLQIGAKLAGTGPQTLKSLFNYGQKLGIGFQIQDDILGVFGEEKKLGKSAASDVREGKKTLLIVELFKEIEKLKRTSEKKGRETEEKLLRIYGNKKAGQKELAWLRKKMIELGALKKVRQKAIQLIEESEEILKGIKIREKEKQFLREIGQYIIKRKF